MPEFLPNVGYVALGHVVTGHARKVIVRAEPSLLEFMLEATLDHRMLSELTHVNRTQPVNLCRNRVLFYQGFFCESELQRIIGRQRNVQPALEVFREWISLICEEKGVVAQRRHRNANLVQVEDVL